MQLLEQYEYDINFQSVLLLTMPLIIVCACLRKLRFIAPLSTLANFALITGVITIMYYSCSGLTTENRRFTYDKWSDLPTMFGIMMFSFEGIGLVNIISTYKPLIVSCLFRTNMYVKCFNGCVVQS